MPPTPPNAALPRNSQSVSRRNDPREALAEILSWLGAALLVAVAIAALIHAVTAWYSRRIFLENLAYLMVRYRFRLEEDPELLLQVGAMLQLERTEDDTIESYARRVETALDLEKARAKVLARGRLPSEPR